MRVIKTYNFKIGTKIPFSTLPSIVHQFFDEQKLTYHKFLYYFDESVFNDMSYEETLAKGSCAKAVKDCPALGKIHFMNGKDYGLFDNLFLSNIDVDTDCTEEDILPQMNKIHRRYGFYDANLYYYDINFFNKVIPYERDLSFAESRAKYCSREVNPLMHLGDQPYGSGVFLHRDSVVGGCISLSVDIWHDGQIYDATQYGDAMKALLPNIKPKVGISIYLNDEEKQKIAYWNEQIQPALEKAESFFAERIPTEKRQNSDPSNYNIAPKLKKLAKQYGYSYEYWGNGIYVLEKRSARGHVLQVFVDSGPSHYDTNYSIGLHGIGFGHTLYKTMQTPTNQAESEACSEKFFATVSEFEKTFLSELDLFYEETPDWFIPSTFFDYYM